MKKFAIRVLLTRYIVPLGDIVPLGTAEKKSTRAIQIRSTSKEIRPTTILKLAYIERPLQPLLPNAPASLAEPLRQLKEATQKRARTPDETGQRPLRPSPDAKPQSPQKPARRKKR